MRRMVATGSALFTILVLGMTSSASAQVTVSPTSLSYGSFVIKTSSPAKSVTLKNGGSQKLTISSITSNLSDFVVSSNCPIKPATLASKASCTINVTFTPVSAGARNGTISVAHNASGSPLRFSVAGTGVSPVTVSPASLSFGSLAKGKTSTAQNLTITNNQTFLLRVTSITANLADFSSTTTCPLSPNTLASHGSCTVSVKFTPQATGGRNGTLTIASNAVTSPNTVALSGTGLSPTLASIAVSPSSASLGIGSTLQFSAAGTYSDGSTQSMTSSATWRSSSTRVATVSGGLARGVAQGSTTISATSGSITGSATLNVTTTVSLVSITVTPGTASVPLGTTQQFTATGIYSNGSTQNLTAAVTWSSTATGVATVAAGGLASALATGAATIRATSGSVTRSATMSVAAPVLVSLAVTSSTSSFALGTTQLLSATGTYSDGSTLDRTDSVSWSSSKPTVVSVDAQGAAHGAGVGSAVVTATSGSISGALPLTVGPSALVSIVVTPAVPSIPLGTVQQFAATGIFTDQSVQDITQTVQWTSETTSVATVSNAAGSQGLAHSLATGAAKITASANSSSGNTITGSTTLTVGQAALADIEIAPADASLARGVKQQFFATGTFTDGTTQDLTASVTWSTASAVAAVEPGGLVTASQLGSTSISAQLGSVSSSTSLTVTTATLASVLILPSSIAIPLGTTQNFTASGTFSDGSTQDVTQSGHWSSSDAGIVTISDSSDTAGLATATGMGSAEIDFTSGSITQSAALTVLPATLIAIEVNPTSPSISLGESQQFTAMGSYSDGTTRDITGIVDWSASPAGVAVVSNDPGTNGFATSGGIGSATITAALGSVSKSTTLRVGHSLVSITVTPAAASIPIGITQQFQATGTYSDGATEDVTGTAAWASDAPAMASVAPGGLVSGRLLGTANITATIGAVSSTLGVTVVAPTLVDLSVAPATPSLLMGATQQFSSSGLFSDGNMLDLTNIVAWSSSNEAVATVNSTGLSTAVAGGSTVITASSGLVSASATLTVVQPNLLSITVSSGGGSLSAGTSRQFGATGAYDNGPPKDLTSFVSWTSSNPAVAWVDSQGMASALDPGTTTIRASLGPISASVSLTVAMTQAPSALFGMHQTLRTAVTVPYGRCRIWGVRGAYWADIEPAPGVFNFTVLDGVLASAKQAGIDDGCIFTFGYFPQWASSNPTDNTCDMLNTTTGSCWPPTDLNFDGSGTDQIVIDAITAIATHVNDPGYLQTHAHIKYWEPVNEAYRGSVISGTACSTTTHCSYNGSYAQLVRIAEEMRCVIKGMGSVNGVPCTGAAIDPSAAITTPSGNSYFDVNGRRVVENFLRCDKSPRAGSSCTTGSRGSAAVDAINFHCYVWSGNPDDIAGYIAASRAQLSAIDQAKPFLCGEGGWGTNSTFPDTSLQMAFVARWYIELLSQKVATAMWYSWDDQFWGTFWAFNNYNGCAQASGCLTKAAVAYHQVSDWLLGATLQSCQIAGAITTCSLNRPEGYTGLIVWVNTTLSTCAGQANQQVCGSTSYTVPAGYSSKRMLDGTTQPASSVETIGALPILLEP